MFYTKWSKNFRNYFNENLTKKTSKAVKLLSNSSKSIPLVLCPCILLTLSLFDRISVVGEVVYASNKKTQSNNTLGRSGRSRHRGAGGMTSSSSATSCNSCTDGGRNDITYHGEPHQRLCLNNGEDSYKLFRFWFKISSKFENSFDFQYFLLELFIFKELMMYLP